MSGSYNISDMFRYQIQRASSDDPEISVAINDRAYF